MESDEPIRELVRNWQRFYTGEEASQPDRRSWRGWNKYPANSPMTPIEYLERQAEEIPLGWHVLGAHPNTPVPSRDAGAADRYLVRAAVLAYTRRRGCPMRNYEWENARRAGHVPPHDRRVCGRPQWRLDTIDTCINRLQNV